MTTTPDDLDVRWSVCPFKMFFFSSDLSAARILLILFLYSLREAGNPVDKNLKCVLDRAPSVCHNNHPSFQPSIYPFIQVPAAIPSEQVVRH